MKKKVKIFLLLVFIILFFVLLYIGCIEKQEKEQLLFYTMMEDNESVETKIKGFYNNYDYTLTDSLVIVNPYGTSPLTALILFRTDEICRVSIDVVGKDENATITYDFSDYTLDHVIPIYGLYADYYNEINITLYNENEEIINKFEHVIQTEPLPEYLQTIDISTTIYGDDYQDGLNFVSSNYQYAFDVNGDIRWYNTVENLSYHVSEYSYDYLDESKFVFAQPVYVQGEIYFYMTDLLGKVYEVFSSDAGAHHAIEYMENGNLLIAGSNPDTLETTDDYIYEINPFTNEIINTLDLKDLFLDVSYESYSSVGNLSEIDWFHLNSIEYVENENAIIVSSNFKHTIAKIDWDTKEIIWLIAQDTNWSEDLDKYLLTPINDFKYSYNQHAVILLDDLDNDDNTSDILVFDNGSSRDHYEDITELYSRAVIYRIYEDTNIVEQIFEYGEERGAEAYSTILGDANMLSNDNILITFSGINSQTLTGEPIVSEVNLDNELIWEAYINSTNEDTILLYEVDRLDLYRNTNEFLFILD